MDTHRISNPYDLNGQKITHEYFWLSIVNILRGIWLLLQVVPLVVDLNAQGSLTHIDIQIRRCEWTQGKKMTQSKLRIKNSKLFYMYAALLL